jgi:predicted TIM-barrel fold metal-dependent hydrolase
VAQQRLSDTNIAGGPHRIDVHHHFWEPGYRREVAAAGELQPQARDWTVENSLEDMDSAGVATAVLSVTTPGFWMGHHGQMLRLARSCNDYGAKLVQDHQGRFGLFAGLPMLDADASLREIEYALDVLKADGIGLFTSYGDRWLGDPVFDAVFEELDRRRAVVYTHPIAPDCCHNLIPGIGDAVIEYCTDTTRAIARMLFTGSMTRWQNIRFIWSHAGGTVPFLSERLIRAGSGPDMAARLPRGVLPELQRCYYDVAQAAHPMALAALTRMVATSQILFGTDYPYRQSGEYVEFLSDFPDFTEADRRAINRENALKLLPRLAAVSAG